MKVFRAFNEKFLSTALFSQGQPYFGKGRFVAAASCAVKGIKGLSPVLPGMHDQMKAL